MLGHYTVLLTCAKRTEYPSDHAVTQKQIHPPQLTSPPPKKRSSAVTHTSRTDNFDIFSHKI
jgi:hypothetical protein